MLVELHVTRFQKVKAGQSIGRVTVADSEVINSSLAVIRSEIDMLRSEMKPISAQQRTAMDYNRLRLDWMKERATLASARVNLQLAETEWHRAEELFKDKISSQASLDQAKASYESQQGEVEALTALVTEAEKNFNTLGTTNSADLSVVSVDPLRAAIAVQEAKLRMTEAELSPINLRAPMDGIVTIIHHLAGEAVTQGQPIVSIATAAPVRIVGYLRPPILNEPKVGMNVEIRTRGSRRAVGAAQIVEVGTQLENIPAAMLGPVRLAGVELGLPVDISIPLNLVILPGELVDIRLVRPAN
jgi:HlyD family secretion protein